MSTGRKMGKEIYVGFLLVLLTFLYLSHLNKVAPEASLQPAESATIEKITSKGKKASRKGIHHG